MIATAPWQIPVEASDAKRATRFVVLAAAFFLFFDLGFLAGAWICHRPEPAPMSYRVPGGWVIVP